MRAPIAMLALAVSALAASSLHAQPPASAPPAQADGFDHIDHHGRVVSRAVAPPPCSRCHQVAAGGRLVGAPGHAACFGDCHGPAPRRSRRYDLDDATRRVCRACHRPAQIARLERGARERAASSFPPYDSDRDFALTMSHAAHGRVARGCRACHGTPPEPGQPRARRPAAPHARCAACHDRTRRPGGVGIDSCSACHSPAVGPARAPRREPGAYPVRSRFSHRSHLARTTERDPCRTCHAGAIAQCRRFECRPRRRRTAAAVTTASAPSRWSSRPAVAVTAHRSARGIRPAPPLSLLAPRPRGDPGRHRLRHLPHARSRRRAGHRAARPRPLLRRRMPRRRLRRRRARHLRRLPRARRAVARSSTPIPTRPTHPSSALTSPTARTSPAARPRWRPAARDATAPRPRGASSPARDTPHAPAPAATPRRAAPRPRSPSAADATRSGSSPGTSWPRGSGAGRCALASPTCRTPPSRSRPTGRWPAPTATPPRSSSTSLADMAKPAKNTCARCHDGRAAFKLTGHTCGRCHITPPGPIRRATGSRSRTVPPSPPK